MLSEYASIRARLLNSQALLEGTKFVLYTLNETTLVSAKWTFLIVVTDHSYSVWFL